MEVCTIFDKTGAQAAILPEKGATVISYRLGGREYLYRDQANLDSGERPRCGIPFLFPAFGRFPAEGFVWEGRAYPMGIHGFGHTSSWTVLERGEDLLRLELRANRETLALYPFSFRVELVFSMAEGILTISQRYENQGAATMPFAFGFHPYWAVEDETAAEVEVNAALAMEQISGELVPCGRKAVTPVFPDNGSQGFGSFQGVRSPAIIDVGGGKKVVTRFDQNFDRLVLWTRRGSGFICVEPVNSPPNGLATGMCRTLAAGEYCEAAVAFQVI